MIDWRPSVPYAREDFGLNLWDAQLVCRAALRRHVSNLHNSRMRQLWTRNVRFADASVNGWSTAFR